MKPLLTLLAFLLLSSASVMAQSRFSLAPTYWYNNNKSSYTVQSSFDNTETNMSFNGYSSSVGLNARYQFTKRWDVSLGLLHDWHVTPIIFAPGNKVNLKSKSLRLPVFISYRASDKRLAPYLSLGAFFNKGAERRVKSSITTNAVVGIGADYRIHSKLSLLVQPTFSYLLSPPKSNDYFQFNNYRYYRLGAQAQLVFHL